MSLASERVVHRRISVIDDDVLLRDLLAQLLTNRGHTVRAYDSAKQLLDDIESFRPHIVIADLHLGEGPTGLDILRQLDETGQRILPILLTSFRSAQLVDAKAELPERCIHVVKPDISLPKLVEVIENAEIVDVRLPDPPSTPQWFITSDQANLLRMMAQGMSAEQIAAERDTTVRAVHRLSRRLYKSLDIGSGSGDQRTIAVAMYNNSQINVR